MRHRVQADQDFSEPVRVRDPEASSPEARAAMKTLSQGKESFKLLDVDFFQPGTNNHRRMEAKGLLLRGPDGNTLNLTSLAKVADDCQGR